jgi:hypothetical protein
MRKKFAGVLLAVTLFSGIAHAGDSITPGSPLPSLWQKVRAIWSMVFTD